MHVRHPALTASAISATEISLMDIRRDALAQRLDAEQTEDLLNGLVKAGWMRKEPTKTGGRSAH
jgi:hypothetical protein